MLSNKAILFVVLILVVGLLFVLNNGLPISNDGELKMEEPKQIEQPKEVNNEVLMDNDTMNMVNDVMGDTEQIRNSATPADLSSGAWKNYFNNELAGSGDNSCDYMANSNGTQNLASFGEVDSGMMGDTINGKNINDIINENNQRQLEFKNTDLLPQEVNNDWFQTDFSDARIRIGQDNLINTDRYVIGVNTVGQSLKNPSYDLRPVPPCPKITVSPWMQSTIEPDYNIKPLL